MTNTKLSHLTNLIGVNIFFIDKTQRRIIGNNSFCVGCHQCDDLITHLYGSSEACRWNGQYIYYCKLGLIFCVAADDIYANIIGPIVMGEMDETIDMLEDIELKEKAVLLPCIPTYKVHHLSKILYLLAAPKAVIQTEALSDNIHYMEYEKRLKNLLELGERQSVQALINELIGRIYFIDAIDIESIKLRVAELAAVLSRATIDHGADINLVFSINDSYIKTLNRINGINELNIWLIDLINRFMDCAFNFETVRSTDLIHKIYEYIRTNIDKKITIEEISKNVFLSKNYISSLFKEHTGQNLTLYINTTRINKSKKLLIETSYSLVEISHMCGFDDQSYFNHVFKKIVGISPNNYRKSKKF